MSSTININFENVLSKKLIDTKFYVSSKADFLVEGSVIKPGTQMPYRTDEIGLATIYLSIGNYTLTVLDRELNFSVYSNNNTYNLADIINLDPVILPNAGLPTGGTTGQVLAKLSNSNYDVGFVDQSGGGGSSTWGSITGTLSNQTDLQTALNAKANNTTNTILSLIGNGSVIDDNYIPASIARDSEVNAGLAGKENTITVGTTSQYWRGDKTFQTLDKTAVGLANVDNTSDLNKPISTATQTALNAKANISGQAFTGNISAPQVTTTKQTLTPTGTTQTIDWNNGSIIDLILSSATGNVTLTLSNPVVATTYLIEVTNGATARNLIFPAGTLQAGGGGNTYTGTANQRDIIAVLWDGTQYLISVSKNYS